MSYTNFDNNFDIPNNYLILESGTSKYVTMGKCAGQYKNMYWKVKNDKNEIYYLMHIYNDIYTKISIDDIDKVLNFCDIRPTWKISTNNYVNINIKGKVYYLHQYILDVHDEDLTDYTKTVDHINRDKLDNRKSNLRLVDMSVQNSNRDKQKRQKNACDLPSGLEQKDLPKYVWYRKEIYNKELGKEREFFIIDYPKADKRYETTKSNKVSILTKLEEAKEILNKLKGSNSEEKEATLSESSTLSEPTGSIVYPSGMRLKTTDEGNYLVFDYRNKDKRYNFKKLINIDDLKSELYDFINNLNLKYPELNIPNTKPENYQSVEKEVKYDLPQNITIIKDKDKYVFQYDKIINKERLSLKRNVKSKNIQEGLDNFIDELNKKYPEIKYDKYKINNIQSFSKVIESFNNEIKEDNIELCLTQIEKPIMPCNFSICNVNGIDYLQFCKKINDEKKQYKTKINSYDLQKELNTFVDYLNSNYNLNIQPQTVDNRSNWKTTNKIITHEDSKEKISSRLRTQKYIAKKKLELGEEEYNRIQAEKQKNFRSKNKIFI